MLDKRNRTLQTHPSLFLLRAALTAAESGSPARLRKTDADERLAMQLIARMQARYRKTQPFFSQPEMAGTHA